MTTLSPADYLMHLRADGTRLAEAVRDADPDHPVAACPGWTARDVAVHTGAVYNHKLAILRLGRLPEKGEWSSRPPDGADLVAWLTASLEEILGVLGTVDPDVSARGACVRGALRCSGIAGGEPEADHLGVGRDNNKRGGDHGPVES